MTGFFDFDEISGDFGFGGDLAVIS